MPNTDTPSHGNIAVVARRDNIFIPRRVRRICCNTLRFKLHGGTGRVVELSGRTGAQRPFLLLVIRRKPVWGSGPENGSDPLFFERDEHGMAGLGNCAARRGRRHHNVVEPCTSPRRLYNGRDKEVGCRDTMHAAQVPGRKYCQAHRRPAGRVCSAFLGAWRRRRPAILRTGRRET